MTSEPEPQYTPKPLTPEIAAERYVRLGINTTREQDDEARADFRAMIESVRRTQAEADIALLHTHAASLKAGLLSVDQIIQDIRNSVEASR